MRCVFSLAWVLLLFLGRLAAAAVPTTAPATAPFKYVPAKAYHVPPETTTEESGYFSLCQGKNGKIYVGTAAYGRNAYLVEFDPATEQMRIVIDTHKVVGLPLEPTGYAAQSKLHTRNFVGPKTGKIYVGSKQGYPTLAEKEALKRGEKIPTYQGGYVMVYDPATDTTENLGMPMPLGDPRLGPDETEGQGVIDVVADEERGLIYVITCEDQRWLVYDIGHPEQGYRELKPGLALHGQPNTLIDRNGRATVITSEYKIARYDPKTDTVTIDELQVDGKPITDLLAEKVVHPDWRLAADGVTAYLQNMVDPRLFKVDLSSAAGQPVQARNLGERVPGGERPDSRASVAIAPDGRVYSLTGVTNTTGFGKGKLHHLVRYDPKTDRIEDLGVLAIANEDYYGRPFGANGVVDDAGKRIPNTHGLQRLPDGTLTLLHVHLALIAADDGTLYATTLYPFTLLRIEPAALK